MTSTSFIKDAAATAGISRQAMRDIVAACEKTIKDKLLAGESFKFADVNFAVKDVPAHQGMNPRTGEVIDVAATKRVIVKPASNLKVVVK